MGNESQGQFCTLSNLFEKYPEHSSPRSFGGMPPVNLRWTSRVERGENELTRPGGFRAPDSRHYFRQVVQQVVVESRSVLVGLYRSPHEHTPGFDDDLLNNLPEIMA